MLVFNTHTLEVSKREVMVQSHVQILTNFTYYVGYKPISTCHDESHLLIKGAVSRNSAKLGQSYNECPLK